MKVQPMEISMRKGTRNPIFKAYDTIRVLTARPGCKVLLVLEALPDRCMVTRGMK